MDNLRVHKNQKSRSFFEHRSKMEFSLTNLRRFADPDFRFDAGPVKSENPTPSP